jgi:hypothetical protein
LAKDKIQSVRNDKLMDIQKEIQNSNQWKDYSNAITTTNEVLQRWFKVDDNWQPIKQNWKFIADVSKTWPEKIAPLINSLARSYSPGIVTDNDYNTIKEWMLWVLPKTFLDRIDPLTRWLKWDSWEKLQEFSNLIMKELVWYGWANEIVARMYEKALPIMQENMKAKAAWLNEYKAQAIGRYNEWSKNIPENYTNTQTSSINIWQ